MCELPFRKLWLQANALCQSLPQHTGPRVRGPGQDSFQLLHFSSQGTLGPCRVGHSMVVPICQPGRTLPGIHPGPETTSRAQVGGRYGPWSMQTKRQLA